MKKQLFVLLLLLSSSLYALEPVIIVVGPPGAGKGTFADFAKSFGYNHLSAGDLIRDEVKNQTAFGKEIEELVRRGEYVDPDMLFGLVKQKIIALHEQKRPFIIDGYGRGESDIHMLCQLLIDLGLQDKTFVLWLETDDNTCKERVNSRLVCSDCHFSFSTKLDAEEAGNSCPKCHIGQVEKRFNDSPEAIQKRLVKYHGDIVLNYQKSSRYFPSLHIDTTPDRASSLARYRRLLLAIENWEGNTTDLMHALRF